jgi:murein DD-endopeptidase MepM/ murein hydrolase activator NlpD
MDRIANISSETDTPHDSPPCGFPLSSGIERTRKNRWYHDGGEIGGYDYFPFSDQPGLDIDTIYVLSTLDGVVTKIGFDRFRNPYIEVSNEGYRIKYLHVNPQEELQVGDRVMPGERIGKLSAGKREHSTGQHLHYAIWDIRLGKNIKDHDQFNQCVRPYTPNIFLPR